MHSQNQLTYFNDYEHPPSTEPTQLLSVNVSNIFGVINFHFFFSSSFFQLLLVSFTPTRVETNIIFQNMKELGKMKNDIDSKKQYIYDVR